MHFLIIVHPFFLLVSFSLNFISRQEREEPKNSSRKAEKYRVVLCCWEARTKKQINKTGSERGSLFSSHADASQAIGWVFA